MAQLKDAAEGFGSVEEAMRGVAVVSAGYGTDMASVANQLGSSMIAVGAAGAATGPFLTDFGSRAAAIGKQFGLSLPDIMGFGGAVANLGLPAITAGAAFSQLISKISSPKVRKNIDKLVSDTLGKVPKSFTEMQKAGDMRGALDLLIRAFKSGKVPASEMMNTMMALGINAENSRLVLTGLVNNYDDLQNQLAASNKAWDSGGKAMEEMYKKKMKTFSAALRSFTGNFRNFGIMIGRELLPILTAFLNKANDVWQGILQWSGAHPIMLRTIGVVATAAAGFLILAGVIMMGVGAWIAYSAAAAMAGVTISAALWPVTLIVLGIIAAVALLGLAAYAAYQIWTTNFMGIRDSVTNAFNDVMAAVSPVTSSLGRLWTQVTSGTGIFGVLGKILYWVGVVAFGALISAFRVVWAAIMYVTAPLQAFISYLSSLFSIVLSLNDGSLKWSDAITAVGNAAVLAGLKLMKGLAKPLDLILKSISAITGKDLTLGSQIDKWIADVEMQQTALGVYGNEKKGQLQQNVAAVHAAAGPAWGLGGMTAPTSLVQRQLAGGGGVPIAAPVATATAAGTPIMKKLEQALPAMPATLPSPASSAAPTASMPQGNVPVNVNNKMTMDLKVEGKVDGDVLVRFIKKYTEDEVSRQLRSAIPEVATAGGG